MSKKYLDEQGLARLISLIKEKLNTKVEKVEGKGLSTNDYTDEEREKLSNIVDNSNIINGEKTGSLRGITANSEDDNYKLGMNACALGAKTKASGVNSFATGIRTEAKSISSHAEGQMTIAEGNSSHAEGYYTIANGIYSHSEGENTCAINRAAHTEGLGTISGYITSNGDKISDSSEIAQHVQGKYNFVDSTGELHYAHIVGNGIDNENRSNAHTIDWDGNAWFAGNVKVGGIGQEDSNSKTLATTESVDNKINKAKTLFFWDGESNTVNPENLSLWQEIIDKSRTESVLVCFKKSSPVSYNDGQLFIVQPSDFDENTTEKTLVSFTDAMAGHMSSGTADGVSIKGQYVQVKLELSELQVTSVSNSTFISKENSISWKFLTTEDTHLSTDIYFIPTENNHPANKKYVDDSIESAIGQALSRSY